MAEGIKISELEETDSLHNSCCFPVLSEQTNKRITKLNLFKLIYPVGSIYISVNNTSPADLFGGTWEALENRFLVAAGSDFPAASTGGGKTAHINDQILDTIWYEDGSNATAISGAPAQDVATVPPYLSVYMWKRTA